MNYSFVIQAVIQFVIQALPADSARGQRGHQDRLSTQTDWRPRVCLAREAYVHVNVCEINVPIMMMPKYMLKQCCDYVDVKCI